MSVPGSPGGDDQGAPRERGPGSGESPALSVVVTVVDAGPTLLRCLDALRGQIAAGELEVIVPWDASIAAVGELRARYPEFAFPALGVLVSARDPLDAFARHVLYDRRRAAGLGAARGRLVAMLEDRGWPRPDWAAAMRALHAEHPHAAIGGAIEYGGSGRLLRAVFGCDFARYQPPFAVHDAVFVSDVNVCYKREALDAVRGVWCERFQEVAVHDALRRRGERLLLADRARVVEAREPLALPDALRERFGWGRTYGRVRGRGNPPWRSVLLALAAPLLPALLLLRQWRGHRRRGGRVVEFAVLLPALLVLLAAWAAGEAWGQLETVLAPTAGARRAGVNAR